MYLRLGFIMSITIINISCVLVMLYSIQFFRDTKNYKDFIEMMIFLKNALYAVLVVDFIHLFLIMLNI